VMDGIYQIDRFGDAFRKQAGQGSELIARCGLSALNALISTNDTGSVASRLNATACN
jgi:hypothetical protein